MTKTITPSKITKATLKSFIKNNRENLFVLHKTDFDGMTDGLRQIKDVPHKIEFTNEHTEHSLYIKGLWLVNRGRDYFSTYEDDMFKGIEVSNSCGCSVLAVIK